MNKQGDFKKFYKKLYNLQDRVLSIVFQQNNSFYLTGGTCLNRFYKEERYSDDLDFFANESSTFRMEINRILKDLKRDFEVDVIADTINFLRLKLDSLLLVDFVNDVSFYFGDIVVTEDNYRIDNVFNILANKLNAVMGRDTAKDVFDIMVISRNFEFEWEEILEAASNKMYFSREDLIIRLKTFPLQLLNTLKIVNMSFLDNFSDDLAVIIEDILIGQENTLFSKYNKN